MKITQEHYDTMREAINQAIHEYPSIKQQFDTGQISAKRYRWDLSYAARLTPWICENVYPYANDDHIDTALRRITGTN